MTWDYYEEGKTFDISKEEKKSQDILDSLDAKTEKKTKENITSG